LSHLRLVHRSSIDNAAAAHGLAARAIEARGISQGRAIAQEELRQGGEGDGEEERSAWRITEMAWNLNDLFGAVHTNGEKSDSLEASGALG
jgi:hypothetical protein